MGPLLTHFSFTGHAGILILNCRHFLCKRQTSTCQKFADGRIQTGGSLVPETTAPPTEAQDQKKSSAQSFLTVLSPLAGQRTGLCACGDALGAGVAVVVVDVHAVAVVVVRAVATRYIKEEELLVHQHSTPSSSSSTSTNCKLFLRFFQSSDLVWTC